ncbi:SubName: Full=Related to actin-interacting protein AIP3 {ECO:0000313/EMBL:CCA75044.1} [Serendipita indica DSM 11827]|uniref:Related to actin-interacting protein AIP3 n=1 Tax=Serendipita indica (strain DSM 11827) TaxID=1109443 RepID=G4TUQ1_SERID|nr:SubName: Full=Related to actin-interacting protein AIP3 {ECO:0000313/EMBL:CCA75044.1} [Serendipita indica DSM 11827]CCA75044.1 related to actin-interacting protein AIP3 [Serendipita indica DSM 11827]
MSAQRPGSRTPISDYSSSRHRPSGSVSSTVSHPRSDGEGRRDANGVSRSGHSKRSGGVESSVTRLLVSIKKLLEGLENWSKGDVTDTQISDLYVRFGNDFNTALSAFDSCGIDMVDLKGVPDDLRDILERCLAEEASQESLSIYLPGVRKIITRLLEGLRRKQDEYRVREPTSGSSRSRRSSRTELPYEDGARTDDGSQTPRQGSSRGSRTLVSGEAPSSSSSRRPTDPRRAAVSDSERRSNSVSARGGPIPVPPIPQDGPSRSSQTRSPSQRRGQISRSASATPAPPDTDPETPRTNPSPRAMRQVSSSSSTSSPPPQIPKEILSTPKAEPKNIIPPEMPRYSLQDKPMTSFSMEVTSPTSPPGESSMTDNRPSTPESQPTPAVESSLAALKQSEALQRRASKRFSTYTMSKMAGSSMGPSLGASNLRRSVATGALLTAGDLAALTEADETAEEDSMSKSSKDLGRKRSIERRQRMTTIDEPFEPPVPALPGAERPMDENKPITNGVDAAGSRADRPESPKEMTVYFQVGRQVKKVVMEPVTSFAALRVLFMNKFMYNPGGGNFPEIYIRDPASGVQYELEDVSEVKDKCLLSLNIEPLDQIKQHIDTQIATLSQEIKDLKSTVATSRRVSLTPGPPASPGVVNSIVFPTRPSEKQFQNMAQRIGKAQAQSRAATALPPLVPQMTGTSDVGSVTSGRIVNDLKTQFDEVQNIRRDLGVMRQIYVDFTNSTKESLGALRTQAASIRQVANTKVGGARASIDAGKARLDKRSQDVLSDINDLEDTVESLRDDVLKRQIMPKMDTTKRLRAKIDATTKELEDLKAHITTVRPSWKKTWEQELQNIMEEQQFLGHQEELIEDLIEDNKALSEVFGHVEKVISLRGTGAGRSRSFRPPPPDEGHGGLSTVMLEIRGAQVDPQRRLKAIEQNQLARKKELMSRSDEFQQELAGFVKGKKLKMTGGTEEAERKRKVKDELAFKAMFSNTSLMSGSGNGSGSMGGGMGSFGGFGGGLPGLAQAPALSDSGSDDEDMSPVGSPT